MKKIVLILTAALAVLPALAEVDFDEYFTDRTLRVDYAFSGTLTSHTISVDGLSRTAGRYGRRSNLDSLLLQGNGRIEMLDSLTHKTIYRMSFSSLFSEWLTQEEAVTTPRSFENTFLLPMPKRTAIVNIELSNTHREVTAKASHVVNPADILIAHRTTDYSIPTKYIHYSGDPKTKIDVAILAEGYTKEEMDSFYVHARTAVASILSHEPFKTYADRFNFIAVASPSVDSGVSVPRFGDWKKTAFSSHFSTFYSNRYLTTRHVKSIHDVLSGIPYEHIVILANTEEYGGGGIYNSYTLTTARNPKFWPVVTHEFGHSFGGLADEYYYDKDVMTDTYPLDIEPWELNVTTRVDFHGKWESFIPADAPIPTPAAEAEKYGAGLVEGAAYSSKGLYRSADQCRMRSNGETGFCPACRLALERMIRFYSE
ncbi:MAG: peptidase M64 [Muribaculaceae bacterium]|nr:peptidase M64 [Muribaculaceae bacterium]